MSAKKMILKMGHTVNIERQTNSTDTAGTVTATWQTLKTGVACWVQPASASVLRLYQQDKLKVTNRIFFYTNPEVRAGDRIVFNSQYAHVAGCGDLAGMGRVYYVDTEGFK